MTGQDTPRIPEITIDDPDWKTFEDIEPYVSRESSGLLQQVLPRTVWEYFFFFFYADPAVLRQV